MSADELKEKLGKSVRTDEPMSRHSTIGIGGPARLYYEAKKVEEIIEAVARAREYNVDYRVIGMGSNILVSDSGFDGIIIANRTSVISMDSESHQIICSSGVSLVRLIAYAAEHGLSGLEALYGIPGTVGGAIYGNAGAHGVEITKYLRFITLIDEEVNITKQPTNWLEPSYRETRLKRTGGGLRRPVILVAGFQFQPRKIEDIQNDITKYRRWRVKHQPLAEKTTGSVFRNPSGSSAGAKAHSAGYLLESIGAKKMKVGAAEVTHGHANWIRNAGNATAADARRLIEELKMKVAEKKQVGLKEEIEYIGQWR